MLLAEIECLGKKWPSPASIPGDVTYVDAHLPFDWWAAATPSVPHYYYTVFRLQVLLISFKYLKVSCGETFLKIFKESWFVIALYVFCMYLLPILESSKLLWLTRMVNLLCRVSPFAFATIITLTHASQELTAVNSGAAHIICGANLLIEQAALNWMS